MVKCFPRASPSHPSSPTQRVAPRTLPLFSGVACARPSGDKRRQTDARYNKLASVAKPNWPKSSTLNQPSRLGGPS